MKNSMLMAAACLAAFSASPADAAVRYEFTAYSAAIYKGEAVNGGGFSYDAPDFIQNSLFSVDVPLASLTSCSFSTTAQAVGVLCGDEVEFYANPFYHYIVISTITTLNPYEKYTGFYFASGAFSAAGTYDTLNIADAGVGRLVVTRVANAVPEPGTWAMMLVGFGAMGAALRRRSAVLRLV